MRMIAFITATTRYATSSPTRTARESATVNLRLINDFAGNDIDQLGRVYRTCQHAHEFFPSPGERADAVWGWDI